MARKVIIFVIAARFFGFLVILYLAFSSIKYNFVKKINEKHPFGIKILRAFQSVSIKTNTNRKFPFLNK